MHLKIPSGQERPARVYRKQHRAYQVDTSKKDVGSDPGESDEGEFEETPPHYKKNRRRPNTRKKANATPGVLALPRHYIVSIIGWVFGLISTILNIAQVPVALILAVLLVAYGFEHSTIVIGRSLCGVPIVSSYIAECRTVPRSQPRLPPLLETLDYSSKLKELQEFGVDSQEMVYALTVGEGEVRKMIFQLSITDVPSRPLLRPLYEDYKQLSEDTIDGLQDWLVQLDQIVKNTIIITSWTGDELTRIQDKQSFFLVPVQNWLGRVMGQPTSVALLEHDVKKIFVDMTELVSQRVITALLQARRVRGNLVEIKTIMETFARIYLEDGQKLDRRRLSEQSFWRKILRSHRDKMANFERTVKMCAKFYSMMERTIEKNKMVEVKMGNIRSQLKAFQDNLSMSSLWFQNDMPLQPYLQMLSDSVRTLEISDRATKKRKAKVMKRIDEAMRQK